MLLGTTLYSPSTTSFRLRTTDLQSHLAWTSDIHNRMPSGSSYFIELAYNGNGNVQNATLDSRGAQLCNPNSYVVTTAVADTALEFQKPLSSGENHWPSTPTSFQWTEACLDIDPVLSWLQAPEHLNVFSHMSHTFTHLSLNNATYTDVVKEIQFNQAWLNVSGVDQATKFSAHGLVPPAITGLHNGDAIRAFMENGITYVVGDNSRPVLMNADHPYWTLTSTVDDNGYAGLEIIPRYASAIYYNCDLPACTSLQWSAVSSSNANDFNALMANERVVNSRHLLGLHHDPYMFHQANLRQADVSSITVNSVTYAKHSLLQIWVEEIVNEMTKLVDWPFVTLKHDDLAASYLSRRTRDLCKPQSKWNYSTDGKTIVGVTVSVTGNVCSAEIPVTFPGPVTSNNGGRVEQLGNDPLTIWVKFAGSPVTFTLVTPVTL